MKILEINKDYGVNDTPNDTRHYEQDVEAHYIEEVAYMLMDTYINSATHPLNFECATTEKELVRAATRVDPAEYSHTYHFDNNEQKEVFSDMASFTFYIRGYKSEDGIYDTLEIENMELNFADKYFSINSEKLNKLILKHLNIV